ncbi:nuclear transport factor 2 family protein [Conexibacter sp. CPCC 206217]|uniref:nuclear transport factor 2 family protein n=1 Tax=Conexibacter sp. CPCC 206217 TaxID=3064574 RepID=UPI002726175C|nr:nuclear transport factor 2 family protein [Conexibacter sp. CPCC 206217]MDO8214017.1 nuclear transport factor 2 family protein [Conexibacter sp. CPCC 206217]
MNGTTTEAGTSVTDETASGGAEVVEGGAAGVTGEQIAEMRRQLRELNDRAEIAQLVARLGRFLDEHRFDAAREVFTEDVTVDTPGGRSRGIDAVVAQASRNHAVPTQHRITDALVDLDGDRATVAANLVVVFVTPGGAPAPGVLPAPQRTLGERYGFDAVRTPAGWRLSHVGVTPVWATATPT